jgi:putative transposase
VFITSTKGLVSISNHPIGSDSRLYFTTSTIKDWYPLFNYDRFRKIIIASIAFLIDQNRIKLHGYVIMPNHLHLLFRVLEPNQLSDIFRDFHKFTSQQILKILRYKRSELLESFLSPERDRKYQIWQTTHAPKEIISVPFYLQKLDYIHRNPCQEHWKLVNKPEDYLYSSAADYILGVKGSLPIEKLLL